MAVKKYFLTSLWLFVVATTCADCGRLWGGLTRTSSGSSIQVSPSVSGVNVNSILIFTVTGGVPPYTYSVPLGSGTVTSGLYYSPGYSISNVQLTVTDALGAFAHATINVGSGGGSTGLTKLWSIGGYDGASDVSTVLESSDGVNWISHAGVLPLTQEDIQIVVFNNTIFAIGGYRSGIGDVNTVWSSSDGVSWNATLERSCRPLGTTVV